MGVYRVKNPNEELHTCVCVQIVGPFIKGGLCTTIGWAVSCVCVFVSVYVCLCVFVCLWVLLCVYVYDIHTCLQTLNVCIYMICRYIRVLRL